MVLWHDAKIWNSLNFKAYLANRQHLMEQYKNDDDVRLIQEEPPPLVLTPRPQAASATSSSSGLPPSTRPRYQLEPRTPTSPQRENELPGTKPKRMPRPHNKRKPPEEAQVSQEPKASQRKRRKTGDRAPVKAPPEEPRHNIRTPLPWRPDTVASANRKFLGYYVQQAHDGNPGGELDFDWTIAPGNKSKEFALRLHTRIRLS